MRQMGKLMLLQIRASLYNRKAALLATFVSRTNLDVKMWADSLKLVARITAGLRGSRNPRRFTPHGLILSMNPLAYASDSGIDVGSPNPLGFLFMSPVKGHMGIQENVFWA